MSPLFLLRLNESDTRYDISQDGLVIANMSEADVGDYECTILTPVDRLVLVTSIYSPNATQWWIIIVLLIAFILVALLLLLCVYSLSKCSKPKEESEVVQEMEPLDQTEKPDSPEEFRDSGEEVVPRQDTLRGAIQSGRVSESPKNNLSYNPDDVVLFDVEDKVEHKRINCSQHPKDDIPGNSMNVNTPGLSTDCKWEFPRHQLKVISMIGEGHFGQVFKYEATEGVPSFSSDTVPLMVAVKTLKRNVPSDHKWDLLNEISIMKTLDPHPNVVRLLGCCTEKGT